jgi:AraC-like DNA-binding protein
MVRPVEFDTRGIVLPNRAFEKFTLDRIAPQVPVDRFVDRYWIASWDLSKPFEQAIVPPPAVNLVFEPDGTAILSGVLHDDFHRTLEGTGWVFGVLFRPGGFRPFLGRPMVELSGQRLSIDEVFGPDGKRLARAVADAKDDQVRSEFVDAFFQARVPLERTVGEDLSELIESAGGADLVGSVADLARQFGVSTRTLQRRFTEHVGVGPKWVLDRCRVQAAAERALQPVKSWAEVAQELGYADQAHLTTSVSRAFGNPPATYARLNR